MRIVLVLFMLVSAARADEARPITQAQLDVLDRLIKLTPDDNPNKPDLLYRRALLYLDQARYHAAHPDLHDAAKKREAWQLAGIKALLELADGPRFGSYAKADQVLFRLAQALLEVHREDAARRYLKRLLLDYPKSPRTADTMAAFGDYYRDAANCADAIQFYDRAIALGGPRIAASVSQKRDGCLAR
jgi:hypothetical protein